MNNNKSIFLNFNKSALKGQNGTILIIGGSLRYTGAPIFTALGSFRSGSDLVYILTAEAAINTIKSLYEAIVIPLQFDLFVLNKITACVIGPGLGILEEKDIQIINRIADYLNGRDIPFVIDADGIHLYKHGYFSNLKKCILTPNHKEAHELIVRKGHCCIYKGHVDRIIYKDVNFEVSNPASLKRCGGQGDILCGIIATALSISSDDLMNVSVSSCQLLRSSTLRAYNKKGFSLITSDIFDFITEVLREYTNLKIDNFE